MYKSDYHIHSYYSCDADYSPQKILIMASKLNLSKIALTDHNTTAGLKEAVSNSKKHNIEVVPGIEFDTTYYGKTLHILAYNLDWKDNEIQVVLKKIRKKQIKLVQKVVDNLREIGFSLDISEVWKFSNKNSIPGFATIAKTILNNQCNDKNPLVQPYLSGGVKSDKPYFYFIQDFLSLNKTAYVDCKYPCTKHVVHLILKTKGTPVLAHPGLYFNCKIKADIKTLKRLISAGIKGIEAISSYHNSSECKRFLKFGESNNLFITAGSDFHGSLKPDISLGTYPKIK